MVFVGRLPTMAVPRAQFVSTTPLKRLLTTLAVVLGDKGYAWMGIYDPPYNVVEAFRSGIESLGAATILSTSEAYKRSLTDWITYARQLPLGPYFGNPYGGTSSYWTMNEFVE